MNKIKEIFQDLAEYSRTVDFLPFSALKTIVDDMVDRAHIFKLLVLKNKLAKFEKEGYFAIAQEEIDSLNRIINLKSSVLDLSVLNSQFQNRYLKLIYAELLKDCGLSEVSVRDYYDGVFHLVTAAIGAPEAYTCENNTARTETPEQAAERDRGCMRAWTGHPHLRVITNDGCTFEQKIDKLLKEVYTLLGVPVPVETERKYLISMPDLEELRKKYDCTTVDIIQTYLESDGDTERRVRQRGINGNYTFYYTEKQKVSELSRTEREKKISEAEYLKLLMEADTSLHQIKKQRTCFVSDGTYFELDTYPFWNDKAILEVELTNEADEVKIPKQLNIIKEVTDDDRYKNISLAGSLGEIE